MTNELKERIRNFIVSWEDPNWATCDLLLETAISLLEETIEEK